MFVDRLATAADVSRLLGEVDALTVARVLAIVPTRDELGEAVRARADEDGAEATPTTPSSMRVACIRGLLARGSQIVDE